MSAPDGKRQPRDYTQWLLASFGFGLALMGTAMFGGGVWLATVGGSLYYALVGASLFVAGMLLILQRPRGVWLNVAAFVVTAGWAVWNVGFDSLALMLHLHGPAALLIMMLLFLPVLRHRSAAGKPDGLNPA